MSEVDTSIYKRPEQPNILANIGSAATTINALNQNRLTNQTLNMRAGLGAATQQAVDPNTGQVDTNKLLALTSQDPRTAYNFGDINASAQANATATANAQVAQLQSTLAHVKATNAAISSVLSDPRLGVSDMRKPIAGAIADLVGNPAHGMDAQHGVQQLLTVPDDPVAQKQWVVQHANQNLAMEGQIQSILGAPQAISTGAQTNIVRTPAAGGAPTLAGALTNTLSPGESASRIPQNINGQPGTVPLSSVSTPTGQPKPAAPGAAPAGFIANAPAPGVAQDIERYKGDQAQIPVRETNVQSLQKAQHALELTNVGRSTASTHDMYSFLNAQGLLPPGLSDDVKNYDLFKKYTTDYARQSAGGAGTNLQLEMASASNPGTGISTQANLDVLKTNIGRERQRIAQVMEAPDSTGVGYGKHAANFANATDPRAFAWDSYTPAERQKIEKSLTKPQLAKLDRSLEIAAKHHLIDVPGGS